MLLVACLLLVPSVSRADPAALAPLVDALGSGSFDDTEKAVAGLGALGDPAAVPILEALQAGQLGVRKSDRKVVLQREEGGETVAVDPVTGAVLGPVGRRDVDRIRVNNRLRGAISGAIGTLTLSSPDAGVRLAAAQSMFRSRAPESLPGLEVAIGKEADATVRTAMEQARAAAILAAGDRPEAEQVAAIEVIVDRGDQDAMALLVTAAGASSPVISAAAKDAIRSIEIQLQIWSALQNVWYGVSLGSVLLLAAIGLAITFGVMGVINMAHGEMVMIGAYTTFVVQEVIRTSFPGLFDWSLAIALPLAFLVSGAIGVVIERSVIRWLYGRPLETLLATWGLSLMLQQAVRSIFGPTNREVGNPSWMSGAFELGGLTITYGRLWIVVFALMVFAGLLALMKRTPIGLQMRAVTANRSMASAMGIRTPWLDALTFGLGSGIAGIAGVALSQIDNVSPNLGQSYIIDSFMVVVFGGVGNLWGTLVGAFTLGVVNKFLEPYAGAVLGKILVLVFIILFIQKRPRGLFALKGRAIEA